MSLKTQPGRGSIPAGRGRTGPGRSRRALPRRPRSRSGRSSPVPELLEPLLVDPEVVGELVEDGDPDLALELLWIVPELLFERAPVDRHLGRHVGRLLEEAEEVRLLDVLLLDDDGHVLQATGEIGGERVECAPHVLLEVPHQYRGRSGGRFATRWTVAIPKTKPPMCAKNATPPPACGCTIEKPPCQSWKRNQTPRNRIAGGSWKKTRMKKIAVSTRAFGSSRK